MAPGPGGSSNPVRAHLRVRQAVRRGGRGPHKQAYDVARGVFRGHPWEPRRAGVGGGVAPLVQAPSAAGPGGGGRFAPVVGSAGQAGHQMRKAPNRGGSWGLTTRGERPVVTGNHRDHVSTGRHRRLDGAAPQGRRHRLLHPRSPRLRHPRQPLRPGRRRPGLRLLAPRGRRTARDQLALGQLRAPEPPHSPALARPPRAPSRGLAAAEPYPHHPICRATTAG